MRSRPCGSRSRTMGVCLGEGFGGRLGERAWRWRRGGRRMAFKFQDLIVTIDSCGSSKKLEWCGSSKPHPTGGCGSTPDYEGACLDSGEVGTREAEARNRQTHKQEL